MDLGVIDSRELSVTYGGSCLGVVERVSRVRWPGEGSERRPVLLFLHGRFGQAEMWNALASRLASHYRCLQLDLPGFGRSFTVNRGGLSILEQSELVLALLGHLVGQDQAVILVGHDVGGAIAQLCAIHAPREVSALVLINSTELTEVPHHLVTGWSCFRARRLLRNLLFDSRLEPRQETLLNEVWRRRQTREPLRQAFEAWSYTWPGPFERQVWRQRLKELPQPVLLLWGRRDPINPPETAEELLRQFPDAYLFENDCGHWPVFESPNWVHVKIREFLFQISEARRALRMMRGSKMMGT